jgi:sterol desaturase/sphingolipid hydroxylase (fatty acid hydroxylase superfamily)
MTRVQSATGIQLNRISVPAPETIVPLQVIEMDIFILNNEVYLRFGFFFGIFAIMVLWELVAPRRLLNTSKISRWFINIAITFLNPVALRLVLPLSAVGIAAIAREKGWGLLNAFALDTITAGLIAILILDLTIYIQHFLFHHVMVLWRLHMVHHTDLDIDVTTGARFHPVEIILSMVIKMTVVVLIGAPTWSVLVFEIVLNGTSMFNHSNVFIPVCIDRVLRKFIVTPDFHRVHHSVLVHEHNRNFGFNLSVWDRIFGTYRDQPPLGYRNFKKQTA